MMNTDSRIRRQALDHAAKSPDPTFSMDAPKFAERPREKGRFVADPDTPPPASRVTVGRCRE
jgi:hypothetical protein